MAELSQSVCPIWFRVPLGYDLEGSGVLLQVEHKRFLLTAEHVLNRARTKHVAPYIGTPEGYVTITGIPRGIASPNGEQKWESADFAFVALDDGVADLIAKYHTFLPIDSVDVLDEGREGTVYLVEGYLAKKVPKEGNVYHPQQYRLRVVGRPSSDYVMLGVSELKHIVMEFNRKRMVDDSGQQIEFQKPRGMSGGPVWKETRLRLSNGQIQHQRRLVGIVTAHGEAKRILAATRISGVLAMIGHTFPDISKRIPINPKLKIVFRKIVP